MQLGALFLLLIFAANPTAKPNGRGSQPDYAPNQQGEPSVVVVNNQATAGQAQHAQDKAPQWDASIWANWALVGVGILTLIAIAYQAKKTAEATQAMRESIPHQEAAVKAALMNAETLIKSERALVMVNVDWRSPGLKRFGTDSSDHSTSVAFNIFCRNAGRSVAWITEKGGILELVNSLPQEPDFSKLTIFHKEPEPIAPGDEPSKFEHMTMCSGWHADGSGKMLVFYGRVKYRDTFGGNRETRFGYRIGMDNQLERLSGYPKYNENT